MADAVRLVCLDPRPMAAVRLVCFPFAGAGASVFRPWAKLAPGWLELYGVQAPGREERLGERPIADWNDFIAATLTAIAALPLGRIALYGHSLGALAALDAGRRLTAPAAVFAAARPWPGDGGADIARIAAALGDEASFMTLLRTQYGADQPLLDDPEVRSVAMSVFGADFRLLSSYRHQGPARLAAPLFVFAGDADPATRNADLDRWRSETTGHFEIVRFDGGHFFMQTHSSAVVAEIVRRLEGVRSAG